MATLAVMGEPGGGTRRRSRDNDQKASNNRTKSQQTTGKKTSPSKERKVAKKEETNGYGKASTKGATRKAERSENKQERRAPRARAVANQKNTVSTANQKGRPGVARQSRFQNPIKQPSYTTSGTYYAMSGNGDELFGECGTEGVAGTCSSGGGGGGGVSPGNIGGPTPEETDFVDPLDGQRLGVIPGKTGAGPSGSTRGTFSSGKPPHTADVTVIRDGEIIHSQTYRSGNMTADEAALRFPQSSLATHTENRAARSVPMQQGDVMVIQGQYPPCTTCKGAMNKAARESGASIIYTWEGQVWMAGPSRGR
jgi:Pput_2613-like deaminase